MPLVWIARLLGVPLSGRVAGSDFFDALKSHQGMKRRVRVFLFGGGEGVAASLGESLNARAGTLQCVGTLNPGFGSVEDMSQPHIINAINASGANFLVVFLSAVKAQGWLLKNHASLQVPVRANIGATINFQIGKIKRAPKLLSKVGLEWLWRIKEEPYLWRRCWKDGLSLIYLTATCVMPLMGRMLLDRFRGLHAVQDFSIHRREFPGSVVVELSGRAVAKHVDLAISGLREALGSENEVSVDLSHTSAIDARFFGLFLMLRKALAVQGKHLNFVGINPKIKRLFRLNGFEFLLEPHP
jgi:N-acetylglucosaminyldiphosphoundecaprenol N-acetyl-beta-D-mannosaminyltransferase